MQYFKRILVVSLFLTLLGFDSVFAQSCEKPCTLETGSDDFKATYQVSGEQLVMNLSAKTTGWVAIGFGATKFMKDADFIMGYVDSNGKSVISEEYGDGYFSHKSIQSLGGNSVAKLITGSIKDGWTTIEFSIPLNPTDTKYAKIFKVGEKMNVLLAYGSNGAKNFSSIHKFKSKTSLTIEK